MLELAFGSPASSRTGKAEIAASQLPTEKEVDVDAEMGRFASISISAAGCSSCLDVSGLTSDESLSGVVGQIPSCSYAVL
jgi:hypothetical protein